MKSAKKLINVMLVAMLLMQLSISLVFSQSPPTLVSPTGGVGSCDDPNVLFTWTAPVSGTVTYYGIYISQTSATGSEIYSYFGIPANSTTYSYTVPRSLNPYFWRVSASFTDLSNLYSTAATFTTSSPYATMQTPSNNAICVPIDAILSWSYSSTITQYDLEVNTSPTFNIVDRVYSGTTTSTTFSLTGIPALYNTHYYWRLNTDVGGCWSGWSPGNSFTTIEDKPVFTSPSLGSTCVPRVATFSWTASPPADSYWLQVYNSPSFIPANLVFNNYTVTATSTTVSLPNYLTTYYSRVSSSFTNGCLTDWATTTTFTTSQPEPVPLLPPNDAQGVPFTTSCSWTSIPGSNSYHLEVADNPNFTLPDVNQTGITSTSFTLNLPNTKYNTVFYWRVTSDIGGCESMWSSTFTFKTPYDLPILVTPLNHRTCTPMAYRFQWNAPPGATAFRIQIATDAGFTNLVLNQANVMDLYYDVSGLNALTNYFWRVRGEDVANTGAWSVTWDFETNIPPPILYYPPDNSGGYQTTITFSWQQILPNTKYKFQLSTSPTFATSLVDVNNISSTSYTYQVPTLNETYYWRVSATLTPCSSTYSDTWSFRTVLSPPNLIYPANNAINLPVQLLFQWEAVPGATSYEFNLSDASNFSNIIRGVVTSSTNYLMTDALDPETIYYWRVRSRNADGTSDWSTVFHFTTVKQGPGVPQLVYPVSAAEQIPTNVTLQWRPSGSGTVLRYHLQVATNDSLFGPLYDLNSITSTTYTITNLQHFRTYYWHVSAINDSGETQYSSTWYFRIIDVPPLAPSLEAPVDNIIDRDTTVTLFWLPAVSNSVVTYQVQVATSSSFTVDSIVFDNATVYTTSLQVNGLEYLTDYYWRIKGTNEAGSGPWSDTWKFTTKKVTGVEDLSTLKYAISAYPNPTNGAAIIHYIVPSDAFVNVTITNSLGERIETLMDKTLPSGEYNLNWDATSLPSGVYWYSVQIAEYKFVNKLVLVK
jgi:hypothetical protein